MRKAGDEPAAAVVDDDDELVVDVKDQWLPLHSVRDWASGGLRLAWADGSAPDVALLPKRSRFGVAELVLWVRTMSSRNLSCG